MHKILVILLLAPSLGTAQTSSNDMKQEMLAKHDKVRKTVNVAAMSWSDDLARYAQEWANHLRDEQDCQLNHRPRSGQFTQQYGENLYWASPITWSDGRLELQKVAPKEVAESWASEVQDYDYDTNTCSGVCGHYTQVVWANSTKLGCAMAVCTDKSQVWVCNYDPPGNYTGQKPYRQTSP